MPTSCCRRFVAAVRESGLSDVLDADGAFTLFAPTDHAFDVSESGTSEGLLAIQHFYSQYNTACAMYSCINIQNWIILELDYIRGFKKLA